MPTPDPDCICHGNWRILVERYEPLFRTRYRDTVTGLVFVFAGLVHAEDDFYYLLVSDTGDHRLLSCVGHIESFGFSRVPGSSDDPPG